MGRKLDFVVFGTACSGAGALAQYISAADRLYCADEVFYASEDHSTLLMPEALEGRAALPDTKPRRMKREAKESALVFEPAGPDDPEAVFEHEPPDILHYGSKCVNYWKRLPEILDEIGSRKAVMCYRGLGPTAQSYLRRAEAEYIGWPRGRTDLFAIADFMDMIKAITSIEDADILVVPMRPFVEDPNATIKNAARHIAPITEILFDPVEWVRLHRLKTESKRLPEPPISKPAHDALSLLKDTGIPAICDVSWTFRLSRIREDLKAAVARLPHDHASYIAERAAEHPLPQAQSYLTQWLNNRNA